jgi:site-specific DNA recombinase
MIAALYVRKSTDQTGMSDEEKSVTRQIEHAKAYASKKGWTVPDEHIYADDGISGAEFVKRPGFVRLMNALKPKPAFQVLIMSEESRLGREAIQTGYALKHIIDAGVQVWFYLEDRDRKLDSALDKVMLSLVNFASETERERARQRTYDAMVRKARAGHVTGCKVFGYDNIEIFVGETNKDGERTRSHVVRRINPEEAKVVCRIFETYGAGGIGIARLAKALNADRIPPPRGDRKGWAPSCIREILRRELYRGVIVWNKTQAIHREGTKKSRKRPSTEWLRMEAPELRILPEDLWHRVQARLRAVGQQYLRTCDGRLHGHPSIADLRSPYLLSGIAQCGMCGGSLVGVPRGKDHGLRFYACSYHRTRGSQICTNALRINEGILDSALLHGLREVLDKKVIEAAIARALNHIRTDQVTYPDERLSIERQLSLTETRLCHLVDAIGTGRATEAVFAELQKVEAEKKALSAKLR